MAVIPEQITSTMYYTLNLILFFDVTLLYLETKKKL